MSLLQKYIMIAKHTIIYLSVEGEPYILPNGVFPMITKPFDLPQYIKNWERMGVTVPDYEVCIIKDDNEFILKMISLISNGILPAANSMFAPNGKLIRGIHIHLSKCTIASTP